jgi:uncharacterized membrane protein
MNRNSFYAGAVFAIAMIALGVMSFATNDFAPIWTPVSKTFPAREVLVYVTAAVLLACGAGVFWKTTAAFASRVLLALLIAWILVFKLPPILHAPGVAVGWESCGETAVIASAAWVLYGLHSSEWDRRWLRWISGDNALRIAQCLFGLSMIAFGAAHFAYPKETAALVPAWIPAHEAWVYFTGGAYVAAGIAIVIRRFALLATSLATAQMGIFTLLIWLPPVLKGPDASELSEAIISFVLTICGWIVATSYCAKSDTK